MAAVARLHPPRRPHRRLRCHVGTEPPAALHRLWWRELTVFGSTMGTPADFQGAYDLSDPAGHARSSTRSTRSPRRAAHERLERGEQLGKVVLRIPD